MFRISQQLPGVDRWIGGEEETVLYAGKSGYFDGLDDVAVPVPCALAGSGSVEVVMTIDGKASPVRVQIQ